MIRKGFPEESATFAIKQDADRWARQMEAERDRGDIDRVDHGFRLPGTLPG